MENLDNQNLESQNVEQPSVEQTTTTEFHSRIDMTELSESLAKVKSEIAKVIVGQESMIEHLLVALLSNGHVIIEGVPGVAKTITAKLLAKTISVGFSRIQFTPDLMPSDILGTSVFNVKSTEKPFYLYFKFKGATDSYGNTWPHDKYNSQRRSLWYL